MHDKYSYRVMWSEEDQEYVGLVAEFPSLSWLSKSQDASFKGIRKLTQQVVADMRKQGEPIPEPLASKTYSGKFMVRLPPEVHRRLTIAAQEAKVSLNRLVSAKLAA